MLHNLVMHVQDTSNIYILLQKKKKTLILKLLLSDTTKEK
jgi:hypothetical protein